MTAGCSDELALWSELPLPPLVEKTYRRAGETLEVYRDGTRVSAEELRGSIEDDLRFLLRSLCDPDTPPDLSVPERTGRRRAYQDAPLPEVLQICRIASGVLWTALVEHASGSTRTEPLTRLLSVSARIWDAADKHAAALTEAYRSAMAERLVTQERRRAALVEVLLTGQASEGTGPWEAAFLLGFPREADLVVVAAQSEETLPGIARHLAERGCVSGWRHTPALHLGVVALSGAITVDDVLAVLRTSSTARVGVSPPFRSRTDGPRALRLARAALLATAHTGTRVRTIAASPIAAMIAADLQEAGRLADEVLGPVLDLPETDRIVLLKTLDTYIHAGGSASASAKLLHCHPNTVRYRLRRVEDLTGHRVSRPGEMAELAAAAYAVQITPEPQRR